jgi:[ribosomal protein S18]-alanine N-acetyltransferase
VNVRAATLTDIPQIIALDRQTPNAAHWSPTQYQARVAAEKLPMAESLALVAEEMFDAASEKAMPAIVGFLVAHRVDETWELENAVVAEDVRRQGIGSDLVQRFLRHVLDETRQSVLLEVRESNKVGRAFYRKLGFEETRRRKGYYSNPEEDCIICGIRL